MLGDFLWHRVIMWLKTMHRWSWKDIRNRHLGPHGSWLPVNADGTELINLARTPAITRYRYRGDTIPSPWPAA
jgi:RNA-directed DNA polymerase